MPWQTSGPSSGAPSPSWTSRRDAGSVALGAALVVVGLLFLVQQVTGFDVWTWAWPLIVVSVGLLLFVGMFVGGKSANGMAIPASIVTTTGLILLVQNTFNAWQTWAYAWALIFPTAVGVGIWISGWWGDQPERQQVGRRMAGIGAVVFLGFAAFFELLLNLSGITHGGLGGIIVAVVLIAVGVFLLLTRARHDRGPAR